MRGRVGPGSRDREPAGQRGPWPRFRPPVMSEDRDHRHAEGPGGPGWGRQRRPRTCGQEGPQGDAVRARRAFSSPPTVPVSPCAPGREAGLGQAVPWGPGRDKPGAPNEQTATGPAGPPPTGPRAARGAWGPGAGKGSGEVGPWTWGPDSPLGGQTNNRQKWAQACPEGGQFPDRLEPGAGAGGRGHGV